MTGCAGGPVCCGGGAVAVPRHTLMQEYDDKWHQDTVMINGLSCNPQARRKMYWKPYAACSKHRSFSMSNPNRIRSLIGAFAGSNPAAFHAQDGSGYQFLGRDADRS